MNEKRDQPKYIRPASLNEIERKREVDRLNFENRLMVERLSKAHPVISNRSMEEAYQKHVKAESNLRRRQMKPLALPKDLHPNSPLRGRLDGDGGFGSSSSLTRGLFDSTLYTTQRSQQMTGSLASLESSPIKNVTDFRKQVIASKKLQKNHSWAESTLPSQDGFNNSAILSPNSSIHIGESKMSIDSIHGKRNTKSSDSIYELTHVPR